MAGPANWRIAVSVAAFVAPVTATTLDCLGFVAQVEGESMLPSLNKGGKSEFVYLNRWSARDYKFQRGDVVSLASPTNPGEKLIKRVIGIEGDVIKTLHYKNRYVKIPKGQCWVEGDNTGRSIDSNVFGPVALGLISAKISHVVWPLHKIRKLDTTPPPSSRLVGNDIITCQQLERVQ